ncbi:arginine--tRNA ligase [Candidatus Berkelbacteria bacterium]|nr:arginine--tRNA ligase [Candidatus Berkelbacteria bacterium]
MAWFLPQLIEEVEKRLGSEYPVTTELPSNQSAWLAVPVFAAAKQSGRTVNEVANEVAEKLRTVDDVDVTITGGFVNVSPREFTTVLSESADPTYPASEVGGGKKVIVEFAGPNVAKPMGIGHLRSTIIGDSLQRILRVLGYDVQSHNYLGDWGTQFGKVLVAYQEKYGDLKPREDTTLEELLALYVGFHTDAERDPELDEAARTMFKRLEDGDQDVRNLWRHLVDISLKEMFAIFERLGGVTLDYPEDGEAFYEPYLHDVIADAQKQGVAKESDGALIIEIPGESAPLLLRKSNGTTTYATRDLAQVRYRVRTFHPTKILYCVANEQALHFRQYYAAARMLGFVPESVELIHVKFGLMRGTEGKLSTRRGTTVFLQDVMDEAVKRARAVVEEKNPDLADAEKDRIAEVVGIGALKYFDLSHDRKHDIVFDWDRMLQLTGDSGPYLQYTYVRAAQILTKAGESPSEIPNGNLADDVQRLIRELAKFPLVVEWAAHDATPHTLAQYLNNVATQFSRFYETYPVLKAEGDERAIRLAIVKGVANVLKRGLGLLGIEVLGRM